MVELNPPERATRHVHLDALRTALVAWVIALHALLGYAAVGGWPYDEVNEVDFVGAVEVGLMVVLGPSGLVIIGLLFFISGLLTEQSLQRHGWRRYTLERVRRLGIPWLLSALVLWPAAVWIAYRGAGRTVSPWWTFRHRDPILDSGALWFALVLMIFSIAFAAVTAPGGSAGSSRLTRRPLTPGSLIIAVAAMAAASFVVRLAFPVRSGQPGDLHLWWWPQCLGMFLLGVAAARRGWAGQIPGRLRRQCGAAALVTLGSLPVVAAVGGLWRPSDLDRTFFGGWHWQSLVTGLVEATLLVTTSIWLVGLAERRVRWSGRLAGWSRGAFVAFVIQGPVLMLLATAVRPLGLPAEIKAPLVAAVGIMISFAIGRLVVNVRRDPQRARTRPAQVGSAPGR